MTEQDKSDAGGLADAAAQNSPQAPGERPGAGYQRRTDPAEPHPAANQRAGQPDVRSGDGVDNAETGGASSSQTAAAPPAERRHGSSDAGSSAAAAGEVPVPAVEHSHDDAAGDSDSATHDRPVTGVHRPSAPNGEVAPQ